MEEGLVIGKTNRPLKILVLGGVPITICSELLEKGHTIKTFEDPGDLRDYDLILGPRCIRFVPGMEKYIDSMIKGARAVKFGKKADA